MADHGMTLEYRQDSQERIEPYISDYKPLWKENLQLQLHIRFARQLADGLEWECLYAERLPDAVKSTIRKISVCPDRRMAEVYGAIPFCDDPTESYMIPLARHISFEDLLGNLLLVRLYTKFFAKNKHRHFTESYWPEGTIAYLAWYQRWFLRTDKCVEYSLKLIRKKVGL